MSVERPRKSANDEWIPLCFPPAEGTYYDDIIDIMILRCFLSIIIRRES